MISAYVAMGFVSVLLFITGWGTYRYAPEMGRNPWFGFGTEWAHRSEKNWDRANRLAGQGFMMAAVALVPTSLLFMAMTPAQLSPLAVVLATLLNGAVGLHWVVRRCR